MLVVLTHSPFAPKIEDRVIFLFLANYLSPFCKHFANYTWRSHNKLHNARTHHHQRECVLLVLSLWIVILLHESSGLCLSATAATPVFVFDYRVVWIEKETKEKNKKKEESILNETKTNNSVGLGTRTGKSKTHKRKLAFDMMTFCSFVCSRLFPSTLLFVVLLAIFFCWRCYSA